MPQPLTYQILKQTALDKVTRGEASAGSTRGRLSTLDRVLKLLGITADAEIGPELRSSFRSTENAWVSHLTAEGQPMRHVSNMRSNLVWWRNVVIEIDRDRNLRDGVATPFQQAVKSLFEKHPVKRVARLTDVPHDMIFGWLHGKVPRRSSYPALRRVETFFSLERDHLITLLGDKFNPSQLQQNGTNLSTIAYRARLKAATGKRSSLSRIGAVLRQEWAALIEHKTSPHTSLERGLTWRVTTDMPHRTLSWSASTPEGKYVPSASAYWLLLSGYFGYVEREHVGFGKALPEGSEPSLAWLALPELIRMYVDMRMQDAETMHMGTRVFLGYVMTLLRPVTGYVLQTSSLQQRLPPQQRTWTEQCAEAFASAKKITAYYKNKHKPSRDPFEPIRDVLALRNPLDAVVDMLARMRAERPRTGGLREASWVRDILLIQLLATVPLRAKNFRELTWTPDNRSDLYQKPDGSWHIRLDKNRFKNVAGAAGDRIFDMPVPEPIWKSIQAYVRQYRPLLCGRHATNRVFVTKLSAAKGEAWAELNGRVEILTKKFLWKSPGVGPHAFRHIVATSILRASPGNYGLAAMVLHDRVETVEASYAFTKSGDAAEAVGELLGSSYKRF